MTEGFLVLPQSLEENAGITPLIVHERFLQNPFRFIVRRSSYYSTLWVPDLMRGATGTVPPGPPPNKNRIHSFFLISAPKKSDFLLCSVITRSKNKTKWHNQNLLLIGASVFLLPRAPHNCKSYPRPLYSLATDKCTKFVSDRRIGSSSRFCASELKHPPLVGYVRLFNLYIHTWKPFLPSKREHVLLHGDWKPT